MSFLIIRYWIANVWSQEKPGLSVKFGLAVWNEAGQRLTEFCQETKLVIANTLAKESRDDSMHGHHHASVFWSIPKSDWLCVCFLQPKVENLCTVSKNETWSWLWLRLWVLIAKFRLKLKKVGKTSRTFRCELNQIPYDHTLKVMNRLNVLDLTDGTPEEPWRKVSNTVQEAVAKTIPKKK